MKKYLILFIFSALVYASNFEVGNPSNDFVTRKTQDDFIKKNIELLADTAEYIRGKDHTLFDKKHNRLIVFGMDHKIYSVDLNNNKTSIVAEVPVMPGGGRFVSGNNKVIFCATREQNIQYTDSAQTGIYELDMSTNPAQVTPLLTWVFKDGPNPDSDGETFSLESAPKEDVARLNEKNSNARRMGICDDAAISDDGKRIYFVEPYETPGGGFGDEITGELNRIEILMATQHGKLWMFDRERNTLSLLATNFAFVDGIMLERKDSNGMEESLLFTELSRYKLIRLHLKGKIGKYEVLFKDLPGMPNAIESDEFGNIYMAFNKMRTPVLNKLYNLKPLWLRNFVKKFSLMLPNKLKPIPKESGFAVFASDCKGSYTPIYYTVHDGSIVTSIIALAPDRVRNKLYMSIFDRRFSGVYQIPIPEKVLNHKLECI